MPKVKVFLALTYPLFAVSLLAAELPDDLPQCRNSVPVIEICSALPGITPVPAPVASPAPAPIEQASPEPEQLNKTEGTASGAEPLGTSAQQPDSQAGIASEPEPAATTSADAEEVPVAVPLDPSPASAPESVTGEAAVSPSQSAEQISAPPTIKIEIPVEQAVSSPMELVDSRVSIGSIFVHLGLALIWFALFRFPPLWKPAKGHGRRALGTDNPPVS